MAITPDGASAYVANIQSTHVSKIDTQTNTVTTITIPEINPRLLAITPDGAFVYVTYGCSNCGTPTGVVVINTADDSVTADIQIAMTGDAFGVAITPDGAFAYVA